MAAEHTVDARWAGLVVELLRTKRVDPGGLLKQAGLSRELIRDPERRIPFHKHALLFELASEAAKEPYLGLKLGARVRIQEIGLLGYVALSSPTFGQALQNVSRYYRVFADASRVSFQVDQHHAVYEVTFVDPSVAVARQAREFVTSFFVRMCRELTAQKLTPIWVQFLHPAPRATARYSTMMKAPAHFGQPRIAIVFPRDVVSVPVKTSDHRLLVILERYCREILGEHPEHGDLVYEVRRIISKQLAGGVPTVEQMATGLNTSIRTLERRLKETGWTYTRLADDLRRQLALQYVKDPRLRPSQIGFLLGFSENSPFIRAFRRWTGTTPARYRAAALEGSSDTR